MKSPFRAVRSLWLTGVALLVASGFAGCGAESMESLEETEDAVTTTFPTAKGEVQLSATKKVSGTFDGGLKRYNLSGGGAAEGQPAVFELADGATLSNVIIGTKSADGVHCKGKCTLKNVWWEDVGEDAATLESSGSMVVDGGGARKASDKVFQHNGSGTLTIQNFYAEDIGKLYRACGNCKNGYQGKRRAIIKNVTVKKVNTTVAGINSNYGDQVDISGLTVLGDSSKKTKICVKYTGNNTGSEPTKTGEGPGGGCNYESSAISWK